MQVKMREFYQERGFQALDVADKQKVAILQPDRVYEVDDVKASWLIEHGKAVAVAKPAPKKVEPKPEPEPEPEPKKNPIMSTRDLDEKPVKQARKPRGRVKK